MDNLKTDYAVAVETHIKQYKNQKDPQDAKLAFLGLRQLFEQHKPDCQSTETRLDYTNERLHSAFKAINEISQKRHISERDQRCLEIWAEGFLQKAIDRIEKDLEGFKRAKESEQVASNMEAVLSLI